MYILGFWKVVNPSFRQSPWWQSKEFSSFNFPICPDHSLVPLVSWSFKGRTFNKQLNPQTHVVANRWRSWKIYLSKLPLLKSLSSFTYLGLFGILFLPSLIDTHFCHEFCNISLHTFNTFDELTGPLSWIRFGFSGQIRDVLTSSFQTLVCLIFHYNNKNN